MNGGEDWKPVRCPECGGKDEGCDLCRGFGTVTLRSAQAWHSIIAGPVVEVDGCAIETDSGPDDPNDGDSTVLLPDDEPDDFYTELRDEMRRET